MSGVIDEDTARTINSGRATIGAMLGTVQRHLQKVFIVFVTGLIGTIILLYYYGWEILKRDLLRQAPEAGVFAITPFDVILLQAKIGIIVGIIMSIPLLVWLSRDSLRERGLWPSQRVARWKLALLAVLSIGLAALGVTYGYALFFPIMFDFLAQSAVDSNFAPDYAIVQWAEFTLFLLLSFALAAQLPLFMSAASYAGVVRYQTWREKWKIAVLLIFGFGAVFSPPDPFTQVMWAVPLLALYGFSLWLTKLVVLLKFSRDQLGFANIAAANWNTILGGGFVFGAVVYVLLSARIGPTLTELLRTIDPTVSALSPVVFGLPRATSILVWAGAAGVVGAFATWGYHVLTAAESAALREGFVVGDPTELDLGGLDAAGVRAAPPEAFAALSEEDAVGLAGDAMDAGDREKARLILDRWDDVNGADDPDAEGQPGDAENGDPTETDDTGVFTRTAAGMAGAFTDDTDEEDIGGYLYDIRFILDSVTSKSFRLIGVFLLVLAGTFFWLYGGVGTAGIGLIMEDFLARLPAAVRPEEVELVTLHPVEHLVFIVKISTILGAAATLPLFLYYAWPALRERGLVSGSRGGLFKWATATTAALVVGSVLGYAVVAPNVISWLATDAIQAGMVIKYRINAFGWLVFFTTVGIGILATIPVAMVMFHRGGLITYPRLRRRWRAVTVGVLAFAAVASPRGLFTMFLLALPLVAMYFLGLGILWVYTLGGRRVPDPPAQGAD